MNLEDIQPFVFDTLVAQTGEGQLLAGAVIVKDDGTFPKTPERETGLSQKGLVLTVWQPESDGLVDVSKTGLATHEVYVPVVIEENVKVNKGDNGTKIIALKALRLVLQILSGKPGNLVPPKFPLKVMDPPFKNFGTQNGVQRIVANFSINTFINPV